MLYFADAKPAKRGLASALCVLALVVPAHAGSLGGGGGISAAVSVGGDSLADVDVSIGGSNGINAGATVGGGSGSTAEVDVAIGGGTGTGERKDMRDTLHRLMGKLTPDTSTAVAAG